MRFLELEHVTKSFGGVRALNDVSLHVDEGECVALLGGNGAGKSTLVSLVAGTASPDSGVLRVREQSVSFTGPADARAVGVETVFQNLALCENLDAPGNLFLGREEAGGVPGWRLLRRRRMAELTRATLAELGVQIPDLRAATRSFSGGQRQALAFARAARAESRLLILDEPTAALGVNERRNVITTVQRLRRERGVAVLLVTHNLEEMRQLADRAYVLRRGELAGSAALEHADDERLVALMTGAQAA